MEKQQRALNAWLRSQSKLGKKWLALSVLLAFAAGLFLLAQAGLLAHILHALIIEQTDKQQLIPAFLLLAGAICLRALCSTFKEIVAYKAAEAVRQQIRKQLLDRLQQLGSATIQGKPAGSWANLLFEQVEQLHDFFARYLPQLAIVVLLPLLILLVVFPLNWAVGLIFVLTAPLVPLFMILVGKGAADANRRNASALQRLSAFFYNRLQAMETIQLFDQVSAQSQKLENASQAFRVHTMEVLRLAFLSSAILEFFTALSIALTAVYLGFSYLGELNFGHYGAPITLFTGLLLLLLAPEFYQPLRELGTFYHAKAQALGAAVALVDFFNHADDLLKKNNSLLTTELEKFSLAQGAITLEARELVVLSSDGTPLVGPLNFTIRAGERVAIIGHSGSGKTSIFNALLGFLPYQGSLTINGVELKQCEISSWRKQCSWVGQNPQLFHGTVRENILLGAPQIADQQLTPILLFSHVDEFINKLPNGLDYVIGDRASGLSVGQAQRIALARALLQNGQCWLLDEPTSSLDAASEQQINHSLQQATQGRTMLLITHKLDSSVTYDQILHLHQGVLVNHVLPAEVF